MSLVIPTEAEPLCLAQRSSPKSAAEYAASCEIDAEAMSEYLIEGDVLDIGCGVGGPSALIAKRCGGKLYLLDGTGDAERKFGYADHMDVYNDRAVTEKLLIANGVTNFEWVDVGAKTLPAVSVVVSLISWGWHYPVSTYLGAVKDALSPGGRLILDLRYSDSGLEADFNLLGPCSGYGKCNRSAWERRSA